MDEVRYWLNELKAAKKRDKDFIKQGKEILNIYEGEKTPFNILYSNTETLLPALFSQLPRPVISRRYKDDDPMGKVVGEVAQRALEYLLDTDVDEYDKFYDTIESVTLDGLLPGRGNASIKYESEGDEETVCTDKQCWDRVWYGYAKKWSKVPWVAYEFYLDKEECEALELDLTDIEFKEGEESEDHDDTEEIGQRETIEVYQIWDKKSKKVKYLCPQNKNKLLKEIDDPLELTGFFNCPKPLMFVKKNELNPTSLYKLYQKQAKELNRIQMRIDKIVEAVKARGIYDGALGNELQELFTAGDNELIKASEGASLADGGIQRSIWFAPIGELISTLQQLYQAREACKAVIYEITGISDVIRGQSVASETLGAQKIKESWGTMRLKRLQKEVQGYALSTMRIMLEVAIKQFSIETWQKMTMLSYPRQKEKERAQRILEAAQEQHAQRSQIAQQQGLQPQPFQPDPRLQEILSKPSWEDILKVLRDDYQRSYRLDIETNSTLDVEATEDKQMVGEFMNALGQVMAGLSNAQDIPFEAKKEIILAVTKRFRFGVDVEDALRKMQQVQPQIPPQIQQQIQQQQQQIQQAQKQIQSDQEKLRKENQQLEVEKQQLDFDKQMAALEDKHRKDLMKMQDSADKTKIAAEIDAMFEKQKTQLQSLIDKALAKMENARIRSQVQKQS